MKKIKAKIKAKLNLDVGCGFNKQPGFVGMDKRQVPGVDIVHDVEVFPWPIEDNSCSVIVMSHLVEHIKPWLQIDFMNEAWRVMEVGGLLMVATPYATSFGYLQDPTHCSPWNEATITYFDPACPLYNIYKPKPWHIKTSTYNKLISLEVAFEKLEVPNDKA